MKLQDEYLLRIRTQFRRRRIELGYQPADIAIPGLLVAQTIRNFERGIYVPNLATLLLLCLRLDFSAPEIVPVSRTHA